MSYVFQERRRSLRTSTGELLKEYPWRTVLSFDSLEEAEKAAAQMNRNSRRFEGRAMPIRDRQQ